MSVRRRKHGTICEKEDIICGFACVHPAFRRQGVATELITFIREDAKKRGLSRVELNMWEFNEGALAFYEAVGFRTYRRYMELEV